MGKVIDKVGQLSDMQKVLPKYEIDALRGMVGNYSSRLTDVAQRSFMKGNLIGGTTIGRPSILTIGRKGRLTRETMPPGFAMFVRDIPTENGSLVIFPMCTVGITERGTPIIENTEVEGFYSVVHVPTNPNGLTEIFNPADMTVDLAFTVGSDDFVTVNGLDPVTAEEYTLFDEIVCEFESELL